MKIIALQAENIKKLVAVEIRPDGNLVQITGRNGQGKTSILDSIWWALAGSKNIQTSPIRKGQEQAKIRLDLGEIIVTRTFKAQEDGGATSQITVENEKGAKFPSPQKMLDDLLGELTFDPLQFSRATAKEQFDTLKKFVPGVDFDKIEAKNKADFDSRTAVNRQAKESRAIADSIDLSLDGPTERIDQSALVAELNEAGRKNADLEKRKAARKQAKETVKSNQERIDSMQKELDALKKESEALQRKLDNAEDLSAPIDTDALAEKIAGVDSANKEIDERNRKAEALRKSKYLEAQSQALTDSIAKREKDKAEKIEAAKLPVKGLGFGEGIITLNKIPFDQASDAEQLRASIAVAMALNPKLKVIRVRDGSLLDQDSLKLLENLADAKDFQVWIEKVDSSGKIGFIMEDGHVREAVAA